MHILFVTPAFPPFFGGGERYARSLALALAACDQQITVIAGAAQQEQQLWLGTGSAPLSSAQDGPLTVIRCPIRPFPGGWRGLLAWRKLMVLLSLLPGDQSALLERMARRVPPLAGIDEALARLPAPPDLVHGFNLSWEHALLAARDAARRFQCPLVITPFAHFGDGPGSHGGLSPRRGPRDRVARNATMDHQRRLLQEAGAVLALTTVEQEGMAAWQIQPRRLLVAGGGVDEALPLSPATVRQLLARFQLQQPFALFVGRVTHDKGAIHAAQAALRLAEQGSPLPLVLAGRVAADFQRFFHALDPAQRRCLHLLGPVDETAKHALLQEAAMLLLPSRAESFGIVLLEAWQHATPVVAANVGGIRGVVDDGANGLLVPFGDVPALAAAMQRLLQQPELRRRLGRHGQEKVQRQYNWPAVAARVLALYRELRA